MRIIIGKLPFLAILISIISGIAPVSAGTKEEPAVYKPIVSSYFYCSEDVSKRVSACGDSMENINRKKYTAGEVRTNLKRSVSQCSENIKTVPEAFKLPVSKREDRIIGDLIKELFKLNARSPEEIFDSKIVLKSNGVWLSDEGYTVTKYWAIYKLEEEILRSNGKSPYEFSNNESQEFPREAFTVRGRSFGADRGLKVPGGWLLGSNIGEFGGDLVFANEDKNAYVVINDNIKGIFNSPIGIVVVTGLGHMSSMYGYIYTVKKLGNKWVAKEFAEIYDNPYIVEQLEDGEILIANDFGSFLLNKNGLCRLDRVEDK
jgi:hypothetical protein